MLNLKGGAEGFVVPNIPNSFFLYFTLPPMCYKTLKNILKKDPLTPVFLLRGPKFLREGGGSGGWAKSPLFFFTASLSDKAKNKYIVTPPI